MNYEKLKKIRIEVDRFNETLQEALNESMLIKDVTTTLNDGSEYTYNYGIYGTHLSGAVKRKYIDMKYEINKLLRN